MMSKERELLVNALDRLKHINYEDDHLTNDLIQTIEKFLAKREQPEPGQDHYMHKIFLRNLQNKEKLGEIIITLEDQYITLLGHKVVITEIIDRESYPVIGYFIDLNEDGEPRMNESEWNLSGDRAYCLDWRWSLTLDVRP